MIVLVICALTAPLIAPYSATDQLLRAKAQGPSLQHPLGLDELGRDLLSRLLYGARYTLGGALVAVTLSACVGGALGLAVGYVGGVVDEIVMRIVDGLLAFPYIVVAVFLAAFLGPGLVGAVIAVGIASAPGYTRLVRGIVLTVREQEYIGAVVACGATRFRVAVRHILPNSVSPVIVFASLDAAAALIRLSSLSFIGMGAQPPMPEWGTMLNTAQEWLSVAPHISMVPGLAIVLAAVSLNLVGEALRDALDPRLLAAD
jgi:peptide/nickel transport system permease protein